MRFHEIADGAISLDEPIDEAKPTGGIQPLTPAQARAKKAREDKAAANVNDVQAMNAVRLQKARRKLVVS